ncbi:MAG: hypothetical protein NTX47_06220 [Candidatus Omnitrophica bacterium]|nr:hypothetical protein [Candidatus Omnitrophota bacterium]
MIHRYKPYLKKGWLPFIFIAASFIYLFKASWLKWGGLIIDTGRELYIPLKILKGAVLYKDIIYEYGPFSPCFNSLLCAVFGIHMRSFIISGALSVIILSFLFYKVSRIFLNSFLSTLSVVTFLFVLAFGHYYEAGIFNYIIPYSYPAIHSIVFAFGSLFCYYLDLIKGGRRYRYLSALFIALALITRIEIGVFLAISISVGVLLDFRNRAVLKERFLAYSIFPVIIAGVVYGLIESCLKNASQSGGYFANLGLLLKNIDANSPFTRNLAGIGDIVQNLNNIMITVLCYVILIGIFFIAGFWLSKINGLSKIKKTLVFIIAFLFVAALAVFFQIRFFPYTTQYRCMPLICMGLCVLGCRRYYAGIDYGKSLFLTVFSLFSFLLLMRMLLNVWAGHYGFYLLSAGMLCYYFFFFAEVPRLFKKKEIMYVYAAGFSALAISFAISHFYISDYFYKSRVSRISFPRGSMYVRPGYNNVVDFLDYMRSNTEKSAHLVVFPEGAMLNFLSERDTPLRYLSFLPVDFFRPDFEKDVIRQLEENKILYIAILPRDTSEYGPARFGMDYAQGLMAYIADKYVIKKQFGPMPFTSKDFGVLLLERK